MKLAKSEDLKSVIALYDACRDRLNAQGIDQWSHGYPGVDIIQKDIENEDLWMLSFEGSTAAAVVLNQSAATRYQEVNWNCRGQKHLEVHRLAVHPNFLRRGIGQKLMEWAENETRVRGGCCLRLDTYSKNAANINFYKKLAYWPTGSEILWPPVESPFLCFEKLL